MLTPVFICGVAIETYYVGNGNQADHIVVLEVTMAAVCRVWVNKKRATRTMVKHNSNNPVWEEDLKLLVHMPEMQALNVELRDWDVMNPSDLIGR